MAEQPIRLTEQDIQGLTQSVMPRFSAADQINFSRRVAIYRNLQSGIETIRNQQSRLLAQDKENLIGSQVIAITAYTLLERATTLTTIDPNHLYEKGMGKVLWGHIRVALDEKSKRLPRWISRWARPVHPLLEEPLLANLLAFPDLGHFSVLLILT